MSSPPETLVTEARSEQVAKTAPPATGATLFLRAAGWLIGLGGLVVGFYLLTNAPPEPSQSLQYQRDGDLMADAQRLERTIFLAAGWGLMINGVVIGVLLNVVASIGEAVRDLWKAQFNR